MIIYGIVLFILFVNVRGNNGGCSEDNWPHSCQANFIIGPHKCEPCRSGSYGCNCSLPCQVNTYGQGCYYVCHCSDAEFCDHVTGCTKNSSVSTESTERPLVNSSVFPYKNGEKATSSQQIMRGNPIKNLTMYLVVSTVIVVVFSTLSVCILIRVSKGYYKRKYSRLLNQLQSNEPRAEDTNIYSECDEADSLHIENNIYDHSRRVDYDILSLRNQLSGVIIYEEYCHSDIIPPLSKPEHNSSSVHKKSSELDFDLEPECFLNLFEEERKDAPPCHLLNLDIVQSKFDSVTKL